VVVAIAVLITRFTLTTGLRINASYLSAVEAFQLLTDGVNTPLPASPRKRTRCQNRRRP
jgi:hypothetical protein